MRCLSKLVSVKVNALNFSLKALCNRTGHITPHFGSHCRLVMTRASFSKHSWPLSTTLIECTLIRSNPRWCFSSVASQEKTIAFFAWSSGTLQTGMLNTTSTKSLLCLVHGSQSLTWGLLVGWCTSSMTSNGFCSHIFWLETVTDAWQAFSEFQNALHV